MSRRFREQLWNDEKSVCCPLLCVLITITSGAEYHLITLVTVITKAKTIQRVNVYQAKLCSVQRILNPTILEREEQQTFSLPGVFFLTFFCLWYLFFPGETKPQLETLCCNSDSQAGA